MSYRLSVSVSKGETGKACTPEHDLRTNPHWTPTRRSLKEYRKYNIIDAIPIRGHAATYKEAYDALFASTVAEYNARQKKPSRRVSSLYDKMMADRKSDPYVTFVVQFGDAETNPVTGLDTNDPKAVATREATVKAMRDIARRLEATGHFAVLGGQVHCDEWHLDGETQRWAPGTIHGHLAVVPLADGYKTGLSVRPAFGKALKQVYGSDKQGFVELHDMMMRTMEDVGREYGIEREVKHNDEHHVDVTSYTARKEAAKRETRITEREGAVAKREAEVTTREDRATRLAYRAHCQLDDVEARAQAVKAREAETADVEARVTRARAAADKAKAEAAQAREDAEAARKEAEKAKRAKRKAESERDSAASQLRDIREDVEALGPNGYGIDWKDGHEPSLREVRERVAGARDELHGVYRDIDQAREDLKVTTGRRTLGLRDVVASVIDVVAGALEDSGFPRAAAWLRRCADKLTERVVDKLAPETVRAHRAFADPSVLPDDADTSDDYTARPRRDFGPDV